MRLTNHDRDQIRYRIIGDVPLIDYDGQMQQRVTDICVTMMPNQVRRLWDNTSLRGFIRCGTYWYCCTTLSTPGFKGDDEVVAAIKSDDALAELHRLRDAQRKTLNDVRDKLRTNLALCSTANQFRERFPELANYLPTATTASNVPATTDLMDSLRSAGVPLEAEAA